MGSVSDNTPLTDKQEAFCQEYHRVKNQYEAYLTIYPESRKWKRNSVDCAASKLMGLTKISQRICELRNGTARKTELTVAKQVQKLGEISTFDPGDLFDPNTGELIPIPDLPEHVRRAISRFEIVEIPSKNGEKLRYKHKYWFWSKPQSIDMENKYLGFYEADNMQKAVQMQVLAAIVSCLPAEQAAMMTKIVEEKLVKSGEKGLIEHHGE